MIIKKNKYYTQEELEWLEDLDESEEEGEEDGDIVDDSDVGVEDDGDTDDDSGDSSDEVTLESLQSKMAEMQAELEAERANAKKLLAESLKRKDKLSEKDKEQADLLNELTQFRQEKEAREQKKLKEKGEYEKLIQQMAEKHEADMLALSSQKDQEISDLRAEREASLAKQNSQMIANKFATSKFIGSDEVIVSAAVMQSIFGANFAVEDNQVVAYKVDDSGERVKMVEANGRPTPFDVALKKMAEDFGDKTIFASTFKNGSGSRKSDTDVRPNQSPKEEARGRDRILGALSGA